MLSRSHGGQHSCWVLTRDILEEFLECTICFRFRFVVGPVLRYFGAEVTLNLLT